jgi:hypothetical protein
MGKVLSGELKRSLLIGNTINHSLELLWQTVAHLLLLMNQVQTGEDKLRSRTSSDIQPNSHRRF